jgi:hypothetical protein
MSDADAVVTSSCFEIFDRRIRFRCPDAHVERLLTHNWSTLSVADAASPVALEYSIVRAGGPDGFEIHRDEVKLPVTGASGLIFGVEKDVTIELQKLRHDLFFLHAAALDWDGRAVLLVAESGSGKSTAAWALLHHGFRYLSDELAPVDLALMTVHAYPHALCLKSDPPGGYPLPAATLRTARTLHVSTADLPEPPVRAPRVIDAIVFLNPQAVPRATARPMRAAEAATRLYVNALNLLAHPGAGLDAVIEIARSARSFEVGRSDLASMSMAVRAAVSTPPAA